MGKARHNKKPQPKKVFISHIWDDPRDLRFAEQLRCALSKFGLDVFMDKYARFAGRTLQEEIDLAQEKCHYFLPVLSKRALGKPWIRAECETADYLAKERHPKKKPIIVPILIEECPSSLYTFLKRYARINAFALEFSQALEQLLRQHFNAKAERSRIKTVAKECTAQSPNNKSKRALQYWLQCVAPTSKANPFSKPLKDPKNLPDLREELHQRLKEHMQIESLGAITQTGIADRIEFLLITTAKSSRAMCKLGKLLFQETAERWAKQVKTNPDAEKMITRDDWIRARKKFEQ